MPPFFSCLFIYFYFVFFFFFWFSFVPFRILFRDDHIFMECSKNSMNISISLQRLKADDNTIPMKCIAKNSHRKHTNTRIGAAAAAASFDSHWDGIGNVNVTLVQVVAVEPVRVHGADCQIVWETVHNTVSLMICFFAECVNGVCLEMQNSSTWILLVAYFVSGKVWKNFEGNI